MSFATNKLLLLCFCVVTLSSISQSKFKTYSKSDGLTSSSILFTHIDSKGVIWAATNKGLNAFTGTKWVAIRSIIDSRDKDKVLGKVNKIFETRAGHLWVATEKGMFYFNRKYWTYYSDNKSNNLFVKDIFEDSKNRIWVMLEKRTGMSDNTSIGFIIVEGKIQMFNGSLWFDFPGMIGGSAAIDFGEPRNYFNSIIEDSKGNIWVSSLDGAYIYDNRNWIEYNGEVLTSDKCYEVFQTFADEIWVASSFGVSKLDGDEWIKYENSKGIKDNIAYDLFEDSENRLWVLTRKDQKFKSLCYYKNGNWESFFSKDIRIKGEIKKLINIDSTLLALSPKGISAFDGNKWNSLANIYSKNITEVTVLTKGNNNNIWFASQNQIYKLTATSMEGIFSFSKKLKISSIFESSKNELWIGTDKNGIILLNENGSLFYTDADGLSDNSIIEIFEDKRHNIWVVTRNGISRLL